MRAQALSRRDFLRLAGLATAVTAAGCRAGTPGPGPPPPASTFASPTVKLSGDLKIVQWSHFVPRHDRWFDPFAQAWGREVGVNVTVDHINQAEIPAKAASEIQARQGHDLIEFIFPPSSLEPSLLDLTDVNEEAVRRFGKQTPLCAKSSFNPTTRTYYGFCHGWAPDPGNYRKSLWGKVGLPDGPSTWQELLEGGTRIKREQGIQMGIGMSNEVDSNMAARALIWSFGGSVQDEAENVVINSAPTVEAVAFMVKLFGATMTNEVFGWDAVSNNQGLVAGKLSYILNSISAYRSAQQINSDVAQDIFFTAPLAGPGGAGLASEHAIPIYIVPKHAKNPDAAKEFLLHLVANYEQATEQTELYTFPAFASRAPELGKWLANDPYGSRPASKLALLADAESWTTNVGHPGPANAAIGEVFNTFVLPQMMAKAAQGKLSPTEAVAEAEGRIKDIFKKWREKRLIGGAA